MAIYSTHTDQELTTLLREGDRKAFAELYERYGMMIYYKVNQMLRDEESAKDLVQDLFMAIWTNPTQLKPGANLPGYLYVAARNRVFNLIEKGKTRNDYLKSIAVYAQEASTETMDKLDEQELMGIVAMEIAKLPAKMQQVFELSRIQNLSHQEIAAQLGISEKTVKTQVHNALHILRAKLGGYSAYGIIIMAFFRK